MDFKDKRFSFARGEYNGNSIIWIKFEYDTEVRTAFDQKTYIVASSYLMSL